MNNEVPYKIKVFYNKGLRAKAEEVAYGIEEEGLLYVFVEETLVDKKALEEVLKGGHGVAISVTLRRVSVYWKEYKKREAFIKYENKNKESLRRAGKNSAKAIKNQPLLW